MNRSPARPQASPPLLLLLAFLLAALPVHPARPSATEAGPALSPSEHATVEDALDRMYRMDYPGAEEILERKLPANSPARPFFIGLVRVNRFLDWGDTAALRRAEASWESLASGDDAPAGGDGVDPQRNALFRALAVVQLSHAASLRGERFRPARLAISAERRLRAVDRPEARAALMLLDYYRGRLLERLPLIGEPEFDEETFARRAETTPVLHDLFLGPVFWIQVDRGRHAAADSLTRTFLRRYPDNRIARQLRLDGLFHAGAYDAALPEQEKLREEYAALAVRGARRDDRLPLGYYRAVGALARLQAARGRTREAAALHAEWMRAEREGLAPWLPPSLRKDLRNLETR